MTESELINVSNLKLLSVLYMQKYSFYEDILILKFTDFFAFLEQASQQDRKFIRNIFVSFNDIFHHKSTLPE